MANPVYFPILRAKAGEIDAIGRLAPVTRGFTRPLLDFPVQKSKDHRPLARYLTEKVHEIAASWGTSDEICLDFSRYEPDSTLHNEGHIADLAFKISRQLRLKAVPVTAPLSLRGPQYFEAMARVLTQDGRGIAVRVPNEDLVRKAAIERTLAETLNLLVVAPGDVDVYLDAESLPLGPPKLRDETSIANALRAAAEVVHDLGCRRAIFVASNLPDASVRHKRGEVLRASRAEFRVWRDLSKDLSYLAFGDYGIVHPRQTESEARVNPPSRVRLTTDDEYVLFKGSRREIRAVSRTAADSEAMTGHVPSWGANCVRECARGYGSPGAPKDWVARDTNMHIEGTVAAITRYLAIDELPILGDPWLQQSLTVE
jgi:hypothetical protein